MDLLFRRVVSRSRVAAGLLLAAAYALIPAEASAGCTHPWAAPVGASSAVDRLSILDGPLAPVDGLAGRQPTRTPCADGACSQGPTAPIAPVDPAPEFRDHWGTLARATPSANPSTRLRRTASMVLHPSLSTNPIERPPR
ncbi:MAG: hypothetical protein ACYC61_25470 [Isosphaeraceae bacterium]